MHNDSFKHVRISQDEIIKKLNIKNYLYTII
jgi:hypothetical protein